MKRTPWLKGLWQSMNHSARRRPGAVAINAVANSESLEARQLMSASALFIPDTGELNKAEADMSCRASKDSLLATALMATAPGRRRAE